MAYSIVWFSSQTYSYEKTLPMRFVTVFPLEPIPGDLFVGHAVCEHFEHLRLATCQAVHEVGLPAGGGRPIVRGSQGGRMVSPLLSHPLRMLRQVRGCLWY